jgi:Skp family chaperone for outer membrane proteins
MDVTRNVRAIYLAVIIACIIVSLTGANARPTAAAPDLKVAFYNFARVMNEYKATVDANREVDKKVEEHTVHIQTWQTYSLLTEQDLKRLAELILEEKSAGQNFDNNKKNEKKALEDKHKQLLEEFNGLQQKPESMLTKADKDRLGLLIRARSDAQAAAQRRIQQGDEEIKRLSNEKLQKIEKDIRDSIIKVAKEKGITILFTDQVVAYCDTDLTDAILAQLNKK